RAGGGKQLAALARPSAFGERPERAEPARVDLDFLLDPRLVASRLNGQERPPVVAANTYLETVLGDREIALLDLSRRMLGQIGRQPVDQELALDLNSAWYRDSRFPFAHPLMMPPRMIALSVPDRAAWARKRGRAWRE